MASVNHMINALNILAAYVDADDTSVVSADYGVISVHVPETPIDFDTGLILESNYFQRDDVNHVWFTNMSTL